MTDSRSKRKYAGPRMQELRQLSPDHVLKGPPHKKPRAYVLRIEWTETQTLVRERRFHTKDARDQEKIRIQRELQKKSYINWWRWGGRDERKFHVKEGPVFTDINLEGEEAINCNIPW